MSKLNQSKTQLNNKDAAVTIEAISGFAAGMSDDDIKNAIVNGIESCRPLALDSVSEPEIFNRFQDVYWSMSDEIMNGLSGEQVKYVLDYINRHGLNTVVLGQRKKKKAG